MELHGNEVLIDDMPAAKIKEGEKKYMKLAHRKQR
jgi:hypothetical protein